MRLYKITADGHPVHYTGAKTSAASHRAKLVQKGVKHSQITTTEVEVPTKKEELLKFLNEREEHFYANQG